MKFSTAMLLAAALFVTDGNAIAQEQNAITPEDQEQLTPEQQAQFQQLELELAQAGLVVLELMDTDRVEEVWAGISEPIKQVVGEQAFIEQIRQDRTQVGAPQERGQPAVVFTEIPEDNEVPAGLYASVSVATRFANMEEPIRELVSFRFDDDSTWRVSGYTLR